MTGGFYKILGALGSLNLGVKSLWKSLKDNGLGATVINMFKVFKYWLEDENNIIARLVRLLCLPVVWWFELPSVMFFTVLVVLSLIIVLACVAVGLSQPYNLSESPELFSTSNVVNTTNVKAMDALLATHQWHLVSAYNHEGDIHYVLSK